ncbi:MAG: leucine--tRNA ligase [bacterium]
MQKDGVFYNPHIIEPKWQKIWADTKLYMVDIQNAKDPFYNLWMFPYPSGARMHVGHAYASTGSDIMGRFMRMQGKDVFQPMGFDAFGIHGENYAIKVGKHPLVLMEDLCNRFRDEQFKKIGHGYDWSREIRTYRPEYYKWTQWIFLQLYNNNLAERKEANVNWCPSCKTVLADEQVISGECERCHTKVEQKVLKQWFFKITKFADKLLSNLDKIDWSRKVVEAQRNWIGKSTGATIKFSKIKSSKIKSLKEEEKVIEVFTTRPDTIFGATYLVLSPEHPQVAILASKEQKSKVEDYVKSAFAKTEIERMTVEKDKTGVFLGSYVINPATCKKIPIWVADYVLMNYGTGAIMAVPAHDARDFSFAKKYSLPIKQVIKPEAQVEGAYEGYGTLINSGEFTGLVSKEAIPKICKWFEKKGFGKSAVFYKLRDWLISRQRYWSAPIPIIYCNKCGVVPVPEKDLPVKLPFVKDWKPKGDGRGPLANIPEFVNTLCPTCGGKAQRETDTLDNFLDSGWYFFRYPFSDRGDVAFDANSKEFKKWFPVHLYIGGAEHSVLHLMYTRFLTMAFKEIGLINFDEPFIKFLAQGHITMGGKKMSKSLGNIVNPDEYIEKVGADALRLYLMFLVPYVQGGDFSDKGISGITRFLNRFWGLCLKENALKAIKSKPETLSELHKTIKKVEEAIKDFKYNTAIAFLMGFINEWEKGSLSLEDTKKVVKILAPFAPFITEELWHILGGGYSIHKQIWPKHDPKLIKEDKASVSVQINGKFKGVVEVDTANAKDRELIEKLAVKIEKIKNNLFDRKIKKVIFIPGKTINFVI